MYLVDTNILMDYPNFIKENLNKYLFENMSKEDINTIIKYAKENNMDENEINNFIEMLTKYGIELEENNDDIHE